MIKMMFYLKFDTGLIGLMINAYRSKIKQLDSLDIFIIIFKSTIS